MTTWLPLVVALAVAVVSALGSYLTAMRTTSKAARLELLAAKRVAYSQALAALTQIVERATLSNDERDRHEESRNVHAALSQLAILGSPKLQDFALNWPDIAEHLFSGWSGLQQNLLALMSEDLEQCQKDL